MAVELVDASVTEPAPVPVGSGALEEAFQEAYLRRISKERPAAEVPAAAPVTEPSPAPVTRNLRGTWSVHPPLEGCVWGPERPTVCSVHCPAEGRSVYEGRTDPEGDLGADGRPPPHGLNSCLFEHSN